MEAIKNSGEPRSRFLKLKGNSVGFRLDDDDYAIVVRYASDNKTSITDSITHFIRFYNRSKNTNQESHKLESRIRIIALEYSETWGGFYFNNINSIGDDRWTVICESIHLSLALDFTSQMRKKYILNDMTPESRGRKYPTASKIQDEFIVFKLMTAVRSINAVLDLASSMPKRNDISGEGIRANANP